MDLFYDFRNKIPEATWVKETERWENIPCYDYSQIEKFLDIRFPLMDFYMQEQLRIGENTRSPE